MASKAPDMNENIVTCGLEQASRITKACLAAGQNVFWTGQPGIGKTERINQLVGSLKANEIFRDLAEPGDEKLGVRQIGMNATTMEPVDMRGIPAEKNGRTIWCPPSFIPVNNEPAVVFIDEFPQAEIQTQIAIQRFIDRDLDGCDVSKRCGFILAGNRIEDNSGAHAIPQHIRNRFTWLNVLCSVQEWLNWADKQLLNPVVYEFIKSHTGSLNTFNAKSVAGAYATPRSVARFAKIIDIEPDRELWEEIAVGTCGTAWAGEFTQHLNWFGRCPDARQWLLNATKNELPKEMPFLRVLVKSSLILLRGDEKLLEPVADLLHRVIESDNAELGIAGCISCIGMNRDKVISKNILQLRNSSKITSFLAKSGYLS